MCCRFNRNIKSVRRAKGLNQTELAEQVGRDWTQRIVSRIEQGQEMTVTQLEDLLRVLGPDILTGSLFENLVSEDFAFLMQQKRVDEYLTRLLQALNSNRDTDRHMRILQRLLQGQSEEDAIEVVDREMRPEMLPRLQRLMMRLNLEDEAADGVD